MKNTFENTGLQDNKTNWLAEELRYEARLNVWEAFDNAVVLDLEHRENCDAQEVEIPSLSPRKRPSASRQKESRRKQKNSTISIVVIVIIWLIFAIFTALI